MNKRTLAVSMRNMKKSMLIASVVALAFGCHKSNVDQHDLKNFTQINLVANKAEYNPTNQLNPIDRTLQNAFGIAWSPNGIAWVNSVLGRVSELYKENGDKIRSVNIPSPTDSIGGLPCGIVFAGDRNFKLGDGKALFIFSGFDGIISAWNGGNNATRLIAPRGASYTGLAIGTSNGRSFIYGANFGQKRIDVWDTLFHRVNGFPFADNQIPDEYSPYNIQAVGDFLFVMYGKLSTSGPSQGHPIEGKGFGFVDVFTTDGQLVRRFASGGTLDIPWGVTMAPGSFLEDQDVRDGGNDGGSGDKSLTGDNSRRHDSKDPVILIGNFGDGRINVFDQNANFLGQLRSHSRPIEIEGLWALTFPPASANIDPRRLYFSAGPDAEADGVFGYLIKQ